MLTYFSHPPERDVGLPLSLPGYILVMQRFRVIYREISHKSLVYQENISDEWDIPWLYHEKGLHNYFIPCHRKYSDQMGRLDVIQLNCTERWEGSVEY